MPWLICEQKQPASHNLLTLCRLNESATFDVHGQFICKTKVDIICGGGNNFVADNLQI
jgi:hypothetical protein